MSTKPLDFAEPKEVITKNEYSKEKTEQAKQRLKESRAGIRKKHTDKKPREAEHLPVVKEELLGLEASEVKPVTVAMVKRAYPKKVTDSVAQEITERLNHALTDMDKAGIGQYFKEVSIGYLDVMGNNKTNTLEEYVNAAKFLSFRAAGDTLVRAYARTFPDRIERMDKEKTPQSYLYTYAQTYSKSVLVTKLQAAMAVPVHILFQDVFYEAVKTQAEIMQDVKVSPKVRSDAANSLMTHLKTPETKTMELNVGVQESNILEQFKNAMTSLATHQKQMIDVGETNVTQVSHTKIYEAEDLEE